MNPHDIAQARCLGYGLLADLLTNGVAPSTREAARSSVGLAEALEGRTDEELAVDHEYAFGWSAPPFEGAHLDRERQIGGPGTDALHGLFRAAGFRPDVRSVDVEHLGTSLRALAFLSGAEADALEDAHAGATERVQALSRRLLDEHVLRWVPTWVAAVRRTERAFPIALATSIEDLLLMHREALPGEPSSFEFPEAPSLLDDPDTGLREIGEWLASPARSGLLITRGDITRLGRGLGVPRGFGSRSQLVINLLRSASRFEVLEGLVAALDREIVAFVEALSRPSYEGVRPLVAPWIARAEASRATLHRIESAAGREEDAEDAEDAT